MGGACFAGGVHVDRDVVFGLIEIEFVCVEACGGQDLVFDLGKFQFVRPPLEDMEEDGVASLG